MIDNKYWNNPTGLIEYVCSNNEDVFQSDKDVKFLFQIAKKYGLTIQQKFIDCVNNNFSLYLNFLMDPKLARPGHYYYGRVFFYNSTIRTILDYAWCLSKENRALLIRSCQSIATRFYNNAGKKLISSVSNLIDKSDICLATYFIKYNCSSLNINCLKRLISIVPEGIKNKEIQEIMSRIPKYKAMVYDEAEVNNNLDTKIKLLKEITRTTSSMKNIQFKLKIGKEDLLKLAPVMRFKFLSHALRREIGYAFFVSNSAELKRRLSYYPSSSANIYVDVISPEDMKELLFSLTIKKNDKVSGWLEKYTKYYELVTNANNNNQV